MLKIKSKLKTNIDLTPLVDVVFTLLLFFILSYKEMGINSHKISLPESKKADILKLNKQLPIVVTIKNSQLYIQKQKTNFKNLKNKLKNSLTKYNNLPELIISGEKDTPYYFIIKIIDIAKSIGLKTIHLHTRKQKPLVNNEN